MIINLKDPVVVKLETGLVIFYLLYLNTGFALGSETNALSNFMSNLNYFITFILVLPRANKILYAFSKDIFLVSLVALSAASFLWSVEPETSIRMGIGIIRVSLLGAYLAVRFSVQDLLKIIGLVLGVSAVWSLLVVFGMPGQGIRDGAWIGIYGHKNLLGRRMSLGAILFYFWALESRRWQPRPILWSLLSLSVLLVLMSKSFASLFLLISLVAFIPFYKSIKNKADINLRVALLALLLFSSLSSAIVVLENIATIFGLFGKDLSLTGRIPIWISMLQLSADRPLLGYGVGNALWKIPALVARTGQEWDAPDSHNGFVELLVGLGVIGLSLFILSFITTSLKAIYYAQLKDSKTIQNFWLFQFMIILVIMNFSEDELFKAGTVWMYYVMIALSVKMFVPREYNFSNLHAENRKNLYLFKH